MHSLIFFNLFLNSAEQTANTGPSTHLIMKSWVQLSSALDAGWRHLLLTEFWARQEQGNGNAANFLEEQCCAICHLVIPNDCTILPQSVVVFGPCESANV